VRLAGWDLSVQGRVAPKSTLLLYLYLVGVPPDEEHTIVLNARGTANPRLSRGTVLQGVTAVPVCLIAVICSCTAGLVAETDYFIRLKGVAGKDVDAAKASGAALASGRFQMKVPAPASRLGAQGG
jgi:hypothetical protein